MKYSKVVEIFCQVLQFSISSSSVDRFSESTSMNKRRKLTDLVVTLHITTCIFLTFANLFDFLDTVKLMSYFKCISCSQ